MVVYCDIDNTICSTEGKDYEHALPIPSKITRINEHFDNGDEVVYWTSRGGTSGFDWIPFTYEQLKSWGCKFHLLTQKPSFDICYDDKAEKL